MNEQYDYGYEVPPVQNQVVVPQTQDELDDEIEKRAILKWINVLFVTNAFAYILIVLFNIGVFIATMFYRPDIMSYAISFFGLTILGAKIVIRNG